MRNLCLIVILSVFTILSVEAKSKPAAIASAHPLATQAGMQILAAGGNAFDAAIAVSAALAVVEPFGSGIGGGGLYLLHQKKRNRDIMIDARETAPLAATADMYIKNGVADTKASRVGALAAGIPGIPAAIDHLADKYGRLSLAESLAPAIKLAEQGFAVTPRYIRMAEYARELFSPAAKDIFFASEKLELGQLIIQKDLANTLRQIAQHGRKGFYTGTVADKLVAAVKKGGGIWSYDDLKDYQVKEREPVRFNYHDSTITTAALPSSGGLVLAEVLQMLDNYPLEKMNGVEQVHLLAETMRRAYRDRAAYMGDSDFVDVPVEKLLNPYYADGLATTIRMDKATPSDMLATVIDDERSKGEDTTHFSIIDKYGNRVAATLSINFPFGSGFVAEGTGVILNNEMDDFSIQPGVANGYGLIGSHANAIQGGKRMLSSMTPTFIENDERIAVVGTPGGSRIITMVLFAILKFTKGDAAADIVAMPRFHHQYMPDTIQYETDGLSREMRLELQLLGHHLKPLNRQYGNMQMVIWDKQTQSLSAASDPRGEGLSLVK